MPPILTLSIIGGVLVGWVGLIYFCGTSRFGRSKTQAWIDAIGELPGARQVARLLDYYHGALRASFHYIEFSILCTIFVALTTLGTFEIGVAPWPYLGYGLTCLLAYLDEKHQAQTPGRMFRRVDFMHSLCGASLAFLALQINSLVGS
jgi:hypothetical protein